jgi:hypothetical protein
MVLDTSAIIAILFDEPEAEVFERQIADDPLRLLSAGSAEHARDRRKSLCWRSFLLVAGVQHEFRWRARANCKRRCKTKEKPRRDAAKAF